MRGYLFNKITSRFCKQLYSTGRNRAFFWKRISVGELVNKVAPKKANTGPLAITSKLVMETSGILIQGKQQDLQETCCNRIWALLWRTSASQNFS